MGEREVKRVFLHAAGIGLIGLLCLVAVDLDFFDPGPPCPQCGGEGVIPRTMPGPPGIPLVEAKADCGPCDGSGLKAPYTRRLGRAVPRIRELLWRLFWVAAIIGLVWGLKAVDCRLCGGSGRLALQARPPGKPAFREEIDCVACGGRGRLGVLDRFK